ncbi:MAG: uroporphyrinogen decarboxylase family protein [Rectinemataceae bacterium]
MTHRERLLRSLNHKEGDRVPIDIGGTLITGIAKGAYHDFTDYLGMPVEDPPFFDIVQQLVEPSESFLERFDIDVRNVSPANGCGWKLDMRDDGEYLSFVDEWGITWAMPKSGGHYFDMIGHPLAKDPLSVEDIEAIELPDMEDGTRYLNVRAQAQKIRDRGYGVVMSSIGAGIHELGGWMRGYENYYADLLLDEELAASYLDRFLEVKMKYWDRVLSEAGDLIDVVQEADDLGSQNAMLVSPETYRKLVKPRHKELFDLIHKKSDAKVFIHSCGSFIQVIPDLIEVGVEILNPVQYTAEGMDARLLKQRFGKDLVFWGGGVDTQKTLPRGTPDEVRRNVREQIEIFAPGGGFVFNTVHNIQADVPPENLAALFEAFKEYAPY